MSRFRLPFTTPRQLHRDIDDELAFHLEVSAEAHQQKGLSPAEARARAEARLGDVTRLHRALYRIDHLSEREKRAMAWVTDLRDDLRFSLRRVRRRPLLFTMILLTLALGTGTVTTFFGAADAILLRPLPLEDPDRVVTLWRAPVSAPDVRSGLASGTVQDLAEEARTFEAIAGAEPYGYDFAVDGVPHSIPAWRVTARYFSILRTRPHLGRLLAPTDFRPDAPAVVVVSHDFFQRRLGADPSAVGGVIPLDGAPYQLVGVLREDFPLLEGRDLFTPLVIQGEAREARRSDYFAAFGLLRPGVPLAAGIAELEELAARSDARIIGPQTARELHVIPLAESILGPARAGLGLLAAGAVLLLLMAASNAAGLLVADTLDRRHELVIRASLGAGRARMLRQLMTEAVLLAFAAGAAGTMIGAAGLRLFQGLAPADLPRIAELGVDPRLLGITLAATTLVALVLGILPARLIAGSERHEGLRPSGSHWGGRAGRRSRLLLVGTQVAVASVLLGTGGLLIRSWQALQAEEQGYRAAGTVASEGHLWGFFPTPAARADFGRQAVEHLAARPGVLAAALISSLPLAPSIGNEQARVHRQGSDPEFVARAVVGTPGLFELLEIPIIAGRGFDAADQAAGEPVVVLSRGLAATLFPGQDPVGQLVAVAFGGPPVVRRVVGTAGDVRFRSPAEAAGPTLYLPHAQAPTGSVYLVTRHSEVSTAAVNEALASLRELVPGASVEGTIDLGQLLRDASAPRRFAMLLLTAFSGIALCLTAIGLFGMLAQSVRARRQELGVRLAVGAWPGALRNMVVAQGLRLSLAGVVVGLLLLLLASGLLRRVLYGVPVHDPLTLTSVVVLVLAVALIASWWPARQATRVDPIEVLKGER